MPREIEWLTDRGSIYRDKSVQNLGRSLGLKPCLTAPYSPSSNGMAEAFVGTFKRDYVYVNDCYSANIFFIWSFAIERRMRALIIIKIFPFRH
jgi:putative transposase